LGGGRHALMDSVSLSPIDGDKPRHAWAPRGETEWPAWLALQRDAGRDVGARPAFAGSGDNARVAPAMPRGRVRWISHRGPRSAAWNS
jgi:hypothetical protein